MKKVLLFMCAVVLVAGCVSNKSLKADREKISVLEARQNQQDTELEVLRKDILAERKNIEDLTVRLSGVSGSEMIKLRGDLADLTELNKNLERRVVDLRSSVTTELATIPKLDESEIRSTLALLEKTSAEMREELDFLILDTDHNFDAYTEYLAELRDNRTFTGIEGNVMTPELAKTIEDMSAKFQADLDNLRAMVYSMQDQDFVASTDPAVRANTFTALNQQMLSLERDMTDKIIAEAETRNESMDYILTRMEDLELDLEYYLEGERSERELLLAEIDNKLDLIQTDIEKIKAQTKDSTAAVKSDLNMLKSRVESVNQEISSVTTDLEAVIVKERAAAEKKRKTGMNAAYQAALAQYHRKNHDQSINMFKDFILAYPEQDLAVNAEYWIGENYYATGRFVEALRSFEYVSTNHPTHQKGADAKLKIGLCYYLLKDNYSANAQFSQLKEQYPQYGRMDIVNKYLRLTEYR
ncbi:MAG: tetratricopeptide repeat protein [Candidatus Cloacimonadaceae bacterium]|nr:tetratricopeptide repeat protein [Candidatus Cloacimonadaceae bacterium]